MQLENSRNRKCLVLLHASFLNEAYITKKFTNLQDVAAKVENAVEGDVEEPSQSSSDFDFFQQTTQESTTDTCSEFNSSFDYDDKLVQDDNEDSWLRKYYPYSPSDMQLVKPQNSLLEI